MTTFFERFWRPVALGMSVVWAACIVGHFTDPGPMHER